MKRILAFALSAALIAGGCAPRGKPAVTAPPPEASPTVPHTPISRYADSPGAASFTVSTADELAALAEIVNGTARGIARDDFSGKTVRLTQNIDLSRYDNWIAIGVSAIVINGKEYDEWILIGMSMKGFIGMAIQSEAGFSGDGDEIYAIDHPFAGTFDGGGHVISNLTVNRPEKYLQGLFGYIKGGRVENLGLEGANITGHRTVGGVAGRVESSSVANCYFSGTVNGDLCVGGVVGNAARSSVANCYSAGAVSGNFIVGGVVGDLLGGSRVSNCYSVSAVMGIGMGSGIGGVAGHIKGGMVISCYSAGMVSGGDVGGVAGWITIGHEIECGEESDANCVSACDTSGVVNSAALNPEVVSADTGKKGENVTGRVVASLCRYIDSSICEGVVFSNNTAYARMEILAGHNKPADRRADREGGEDITAAEIHADPTLGGRFKNADGWTTEKGKLPGLLGKAVEMPPHLRAK